LDDALQAASIVDKNVQRGLTADPSTRAGP
jgi:hypothetical protein